MTRVKRSLTAAVLCSGMSLFSIGRAVSLIRIPKDPGLARTAFGRLQIDVRQELETCFLALADRNDVALLRRHRIRFSVVDRNAAGREYLVVPIVGPAGLDGLRSAGKAVAVEPRTAVFWVEDGRAAEALPPGLPKKALAARQVKIDLRAAFGPGRAGLPAAAPEPLVGTIVSLVSEGNLSSTVQSLQDFQTRYASTSNCEAAGEYILGAFSSLGLDDVRFEPFTFSTGYSSRNVVAELTGRTYPDDIVIICAHYDSISPAATRQTLAPGADDDGSGTAAVLEAARVLAAFPADFTVRFVAFSAEEWGLYGSRAYAAAAVLAGERIVGVINLDMIAYADALPEDLQVIVNGTSSWLGDRYLEAAAAYGPVAATKTVDASFVYSDHAPFWDIGAPALLAIEDDPLTNPYYHRTTDTLDKLNMVFFTSATRASLGLLAELAQPLREGVPATPVGLTATPAVYSSLFNALKVVRLAWDAQPDAAGYNVYRSSLSHLDYVRLNDLPLTAASFTDEDVRTDAPYFYVVTAVGPTGLESNRSREVGLGPEASLATVRAIRLFSTGGWR